jgi:D-aminopeptidase
LNDIQGRHVSAADTARALDAASGGAFERGAVGAGTGMRAFAFKAGIGTASRVVPAERGTGAPPSTAAAGAGAPTGAVYTVGVLVNANTGTREQLTIEGVPVGRLLAHELLPTFPRNASQIRTRGRAADGSIIVTIATDAPLDFRQLRELAKRAALGLGRLGLESNVSSGDLLIAFSTTHLFPREPEAALPATLVNDDDTMDALFAATAEATEAAVVDALLSARTISGAHGLTFYALPAGRVRALVERAKQSLR